VRLRSGRGVLHGARAAAAARAEAGLECGRARVCCVVGACLHAHRTAESAARASLPVSVSMHATSTITQDVRRACCTLAVTPALRRRISRRVCHAPGMCFSWAKQRLRACRASSRRASP
jgi:hypothetical protein